MRNFRRRIKSNGIRLTEILFISPQNFSAYAIWVWMCIHGLFNKKNGGRLNGSKLFKLSQTPPVLFRLVVVVVVVVAATTTINVVVVVFFAHLSFHCTPSSSFYSFRHSNPSDPLNLFVFFFSTSRWIYSTVIHRNIQLHIYANT